MTVALLSRARKLQAETSPSLALNMDSTFGGGLDENPWAPTATPTEVDILKMKPESPTMEHIPQDLDMFDPWADPARAQLPDFTIGAAEQRTTEDKDEDELHDVEVQERVTDIADFPTGLFYIRSVLTHKV